MEQQNFTKDLTEGSVRKQLVKFAAPFFVANFLQACYGMTDMLVVGNFVDTPERPLGTSALYVSSTIMMFVQAVIIGFTIGGTVLIAQCVGAKNHGRLKGIIGTIFSSFGIMAVILSAILMIFAEPFLNLLKTEEFALTGALSYLRICAAGFIFIVGYNSVSAVLRGMGDSIRPMIFVGIAAGLNIVLDLLFVGSFGWGVAGSAYATIISQAVSFILAILYLNKSGFVFDFKPKSFRIHPDELKKLLTLGFPSAVQQALVQGSFLAIAPLSNELGASAITGIMGKINAFTVMPAQALMSAVSSMTGQNVGAGRMDRVKKIYHTAALIILPISAALWAVVFFFPEILIGFFTKTEETIRAGVDYLKIGCTEYIIVSQLFMLNGVILGAGKSVVTLINSFVNSILLRLPLAYFFAKVVGLGAYGIPVATAIAPFGGFIIAFAYYKSGKWRGNFGSEKNNESV